MKSHNNERRTVRARRPHRFRAGSPLLSVILCCLSLLTVLTAHGQNTAVTGHVVNSAGREIVGAHVDLTNTAAREVVKSETNDDVYFQFPPVAPGSYTSRA